MRLSSSRPAGEFSCMPKVLPRSAFWQFIVAQQVNAYVRAGLSDDQHVAWLDVLMTQFRIALMLVCLAIIPTGKHNTRHDSKQLSLCI